MSRRKQSNPQQFPEIEGGTSLTTPPTIEQIRDSSNTKVGQVVTETIPVSNQEININNCEPVDDTALDKQSTHPEIENSESKAAGMEAIEGGEICRESPMLDRQYSAYERNWKESTGASSNADSNSPTSNKDYDFSPAQHNIDTETTELVCKNREDESQELPNQQEQDNDDFEEELNRKRLQMQMKGALFAALQNNGVSTDHNSDMTSYTDDVTENTACDKNIECRNDVVELPKASSSAESAEEYNNAADEYARQTENKAAGEEEEEDGKELDEIKDQVRMLQQQQMYQVQMLNYLHFQLSFIASHPQAPRPAGFTPQSIPGVNGMPVANMSQLLAAAMANNSGQHPAKPNVLTPSVAAALSRQLSTNGVDHQRQLVNESSGEYPEFAKQDNESFKGKVERELEFPKPKLLPTPIERNHSSCLTINEDSESSYNTPLEEQTRQDSNNHFCRFCHKVFGSDSALQIHLRSHTGERPFKCNICANRFSTKGNLKVHFTRHAERYPDIEMNQNPIPEYLDNVPTSSGIPYGMSITPDLSDRVENNMNPPPNPMSVIAKTSSSLLPAPFQAIDEPRENIDCAPRKDSDRPSMVKHEDIVRKSNEEADMQSAGLRPFTMFPFVAPPAALLQQANAVGSKSPGTENTILPSPTSERKASSENFENPESGVVKPFSETSKLQRLVDQIDHGKILEKNECHICHRILSCQSALKLHYRTHTGERPYKCDLCSRAFTTRGNLRTHYSSVHRQQLRSSPPSSGQVRVNGLQCALCGSRFMDQQSMQQHMQMHLYMHSQQQQHVAQLMNGHPNADMRMLGVPFNLAHLRMAPPDGESDETMENDDVFDESVANRDESPKSRDNDVNSPLSNGSLKRPSYEEEEKSRYQMQRSLEQSANRDHASSNDATRRNEARHESRDHSLSTEYIKDAKEAAASEKSFSSGNERIPSRSNEGMASLHHDVISSSPRRSPPQSTNSLNALAQLASHGAIMQPSGMSVSSLQMSPRSDEGRLRKMTTSCDLCSKPFTCQSALEIHLRSHTKERPFLCRVCERGFTTRGNLKQHLLTHNITEVDEDMLEPIDYIENGNSNSNSPTSSPKINLMPQPSLASKRPLESLPSGSPPAKRNYPRHWCHICQKQFSSASSLQIHNRTHTGEKPFACSVCGRAFTTKGNLKVHMGTHVWGAGGSRRGRRISMDNPLISPWMQNTSANNVNNPPLRPRIPPPIQAVHDPAALYQQYAALASGLMGAKAANEARFHNNGFPAFNNAASRLMLPPPNVHLTSAATVPPLGGLHTVPSDLMKKSENKNITAAASEWIWKAYQRTQEQVN